YELWKSDGTAAGTVLLKDTIPGSAGGRPQELTNVRGALFFSASTSGLGRELWRSDGTTSGTAQAFEIAPGVLSSSPGDMFGAGRGLLFPADDGSHGREMWTTSTEVNAAPSGADKTVATPED